MKTRAALTVIAVLLAAGTLAACGSSSSSHAGTPALTSTTASTFTPWRQLRSVRVTVARPGLPPPGGQPRTTSFTTPAQVARVTAELNRHHIARRVPATPNHGCSGGSTINITIVRRQGPAVNLNAYRCAGGRTGDVAGDLTGFLAAVKVS